MEKIGGLLMERYRDRLTKTTLDDQSVFYIFRKIVAKEYGERGSQSIESRHYKGKKLFVAAKSSLWMSELQVSRDFLIREINKELGVEAVTDIKVESSFAS
jgi:predicted nucleic acid-binding Zn ribbon protein